jgi:hypothetical protein
MPRLARLPLLAALATLASSTACSAFRLPAEQDPDRSRHAYEIVGEVRMRDTGAVVAGAEVTVDGAREVAGSKSTDATGRFWLRVSGIGGQPPDRAGIGTGPAGLVIISARTSTLCSPETRVLLPAAGPVLLGLAPCR